jgi:hypothetical protein
MERAEAGQEHYVYHLCILNVLHPHNCPLTRLAVHHRSIVSDAVVLELLRSTVAGDRIANAAINDISLEEKMHALQRHALGLGHAENRV